MDARIGILQTAQGQRFYAYANGYHAEPVMGTLEEVEAALGLRAKPAARRVAREFVCTVRPGVESWNVKTYTTTVYAKDRNEAIRKARQEYADTVGTANNGPATITAKLAG